MKKRLALAAVGKLPPVRIKCCVWAAAAALACAGIATAQEPAPEAGAGEGQSVEQPADLPEPPPVNPDPVPSAPEPAAPEETPQQTDATPADVPSADAAPPHPATSASGPRGVQPLMTTEHEQDRHVVSQSRMFSVSGGDVMRMGAIAQYADEVRSQLNSLLDDDSHWRYSISIRILGRNDDPPTPNPIRTRIRIIGGEPNLQIRVYAGGGIDLDRLTHAIVSMLLFERAIREVPPDALPEKLVLPPWLTTGIRQAMLWRSGKVDRRLYRNLFEQSEMLTPEEILSMPDPNSLDPSTRQVYEVSCGVLIMSLVSRPNGPAQLRDLVSEAVTAEGSVTEIVSAHFVELGVDGDLLNRWWALELANLAQPRATDALTPMETEERLREALTILYFDPDEQAPIPVGFDDVYTVLELPEWKRLLRPCLDKLLELNMSCFPEYRPIIEGYMQAIGALYNGASAEEVLQLIGPLREIREGYVRSSIRGRDYLDWYEITQLPGGKQRETDFQAYSEAMRILREGSKGPDTHMSRYLEDIEELYNLQEDSPLPRRMREEVQGGGNGSSGEGGRRGR